MSIQTEKNTISSAMRLGMRLPFFLGVILIMYIIFFSSIEALIKIYRNPQLQPNGFHLSLIITCISSDIFSPFVAIVAVLPFAGNYVDDVKSKMVRFTVLRNSYSTYLRSRVIVCFLLGGTVVLVGTFAAYFLYILVFLPIEKGGVNENSQLEALAKYCVLLYLNGGFWAVLGLTMSTIMESKYIAYVSPFVVYYLLVMLCERYFPKAYLIYPREWLNPSGKWPMGTWGVAIFLLELTALLGLIFYRRGKRRLEQL